MQRTHLVISAIMVISVACPAFSREERNMPYGIIRVHRTMQGIEVLFIKETDLFVFLPGQGEHQVEIRPGVKPHSLVFGSIPVEPVLSLSPGEIAYVRNNHEVCEMMIEANGDRIGLRLHYRVSLPIGSLPSVDETMFIEADADTSP